MERAARLASETGRHYSKYIYGSSVALTRNRNIREDNLWGAQELRIVHDKPARSLYTLCRSVRAHSEDILQDRQKKKSHDRNHRLLTLKCDGVR